MNPRQIRQSWNPDITIFDIYATLVESGHVKDLISEQ